MSPCASASRAFVSATVRAHGRAGNHSVGQKGLRRRALASRARAAAGRTVKPAADRGEVAETSERGRLSPPKIRVRHRHAGLGSAPAPIAVSSWARDARATQTRDHLQGRASPARSEIALVDQPASTPESPAAQRNPRDVADRVEPGGADVGHPAGPRRHVIGDVEAASVAARIRGQSTSRVGVPARDVALTRPVPRLRQSAHRGRREPVPAKITPSPESHSTATVDSSRAPVGVQMIVM